MSRFTETEERMFQNDVTIAHLETAVNTAVSNLETAARKAGFEQQVTKTFRVEVKHAGPPGGGYQVHAHAIYARIVAIGDEVPTSEPEPIDELSEVS